MKNEKIAEKMLMCLEKSKYSKFDRLFLKHRNNEELWDILLQNPVITEDYLKWQPPENMDKLSISIQKKIIKIKPNLIRLLLIYSSNISLLSSILKLLLGLIDL